MKTVADRFWAKVNKTETCWIWVAYTDPFGYGRFRVANRMARSHRVAYEMAHGPLAADVEVDHTCHNTSCVNPDHLRAASRKENMENRKGAQRNSGSGIRGVCWETGRKKWKAQVRHNGKTIHIGRFDDLRDAETAARAKRSELFTHDTADQSEWKS